MKVQHSVEVGGRARAKERWRPVVGFDGYEVSDQGRVLSWKLSGRARVRAASPRLRKPVPDKDGYMTVILRRDGKSFCAKIAVLVLTAFVGPKPKGKEVRHLNGRRGDNALSNLRWGTQREQFEDQVRHGTDTRGERNGAAKLTNRQAIEIRRRLSSGERGADLALEFDVGGATITRIKKGERYATAV